MISKKKCVTTGVMGNIFVFPMITVVLHFCSSVSKPMNYPLLSSKTKVSSL